MVEFSNGVSVYHAHHGAGTVTSTCVLDVNGISLVYYVVELVSGSQLMLPVHQAERICMLESTRDIRDVLLTAPQDLASDYRLRHRAIEQKISSGDQLLIAEILRDLAWREYQEQLTNSDLRVMGDMKKRLVEILSAQPNMSMKIAAEWVERILEEITLGWSRLSQQAQQAS